MVAKIDKDGSGQIEFDEFLELLAMRFDFDQIVQEEVEDDDPEKNELREAFNAFDEDGSGSVSTDELRKMLRKLGKSVTNDELIELIKFSDEDNSG